MNDGHRPQDESADQYEQHDGVNAQREERDRPAVAETGAKNYVVIALILGVALYMIYNILTGGESNTVDIKPEEVNEDIKRQVGDTPPQVVDNMPVAPSPPPAPTPPPPPPPPAPSIPAAVPPPPAFNNTSSSRSGRSRPLSQKERERLQQRINSKMLIGGSRTAGISENRIDGGGSKGADIKMTSAANVEVTRSGDMSNTIMQGKTIDAVLETAIHTDLPGMLRAVVSRDVYAESGRNILIPKGSRLVGNYQSNVKRGQARVYIIWNRVIRPDGLDIAISSASTDALGRAGVNGEVDNRYLETFSAAILLSSLTVGFAAAADAATDSNGVTERENSSGSVSTSGDLTDSATMQEIGTIGSTTGSIVKQMLNIMPTITIDQGKHIKVFVNRDLRFPGHIASGTKFIQ